MSALPTKPAIPWAPIVACTALLAGGALTVGAVYILAGLGWALLAAAGPFFILSAIILRGLQRG